MKDELLLYLNIWCPTNVSCGFEWVISPHHTRRYSYLIPILKGSSTSSLICSHSNICPQPPANKQSVAALLDVHWNTFSNSLSQPLLDLLKNANILVLLSWSTCSKLRKCLKNVLFCSIVPCWKKV